jgi:hypothetical protein
MWATPTRVNPIPDLSRYLDALRMSRQRAGKVVRVTSLVPIAGTEVRVISPSGTITQTAMTRQPTIARKAPGPQSPHQFVKLP